MHTNGHNGWEKNGVGVLTEARPATTESDAFAAPFLTLGEEDGRMTDSREDSLRRHSARRRKRIIGGVIVLLLFGVTGLCLWVVTGDRGKTRIHLPVRDMNAQNSEAAPPAEDVTAQAIAELRSSTGTPAPASSPIPIASPIPSTASVPISPSAPVTVPIESIGTMTSVPTATQTAVNAPGAAKPAGGIASSTRNPERSIRCAPTDKILSPRAVPAAAIPVAASARAAETGTMLSPAPSFKPVVLPPFGTMLPIRSLGVIYTLRSSLTRFELTRDVAGDGWSLKKGTVLIGRMQGSEYDRAYVSLIGFIDPASGRFVKVGGEVLGADGAPGLKGKRREIHSRWTRVLGKVATSAVSLGQAALSRGTAIYLPNSIGTETQSLNLIGRREFVEIPASTAGFVMMTDLPKEAIGIDAEPGAEFRANEMQDAELAELLSSGSPEKIRAALPRMNPEMQRLAQLALKEQ